MYKCVFLIYVQSTYPHVLYLGDDGNSCMHALFPYLNVRIQNSCIFKDHAHGMDDELQSYERLILCMISSTCCIVIALYTSKAIYSQPLVSFIYKHAVKPNFFSMHVRIGFIFFTI